MEKGQDLSPSDWELLFGSIPEDNVSRAVAIHEAEPNHFFQNPIQEKKNNFEDLGDLPPGQVYVSDLRHLTRYCILACHATIPMVFEFLLEYVQANEKNYNINEQTQCIIGCVFDETRFAEYKLQLFSHSNQRGLYLDVLKGFAPSMSKFWSMLQEALLEADFIIPSEAEGDEFDSDDLEDFLLSDDEECEPLDLTGAKYLNLDQDPTLVNEWMKDLENPNFMQHTLLLLAWNCQLRKNMQVILSDGRAQQLFDTVVACMLATAADFCLPIARCSAMLVNQLVQSGDIKVTQDQFQVLVQSMVQWTLDNHCQQEKVTQSEEIAQLLSSQLPKLASLIPQTGSFDTIQTVYRQAPFASVRANLRPVLEAY